MIVPIPGRCRSGIQRSRTATPTRIVHVPIARPSPRQALVEDVPRVEAETREDEQRRADPVQEQAAVQLDEPAASSQRYGPTTRASAQVGSRRWQSRGNDARGAARGGRGRAAHSVRADRHAVRRGLRDVPEHRGPTRPAPPPARRARGDRPHRRGDRRQRIRHGDAPVDGRPRRPDDRAVRARRHRARGERQGEPAADRATTAARSSSAARAR